MGYGRQGKKRGKERREQREAESGEGRSGEKGVRQKLPLWERDGKGKELRPEAEDLPASVVDMGGRVRE